MAEGKRCIVCRGAASLLYEWPQSAMRLAYQAELGREFPDASRCPDYSMLRCSRCGLVFADPCEPGDEAFYRLITATPDYYTGFRWEWGETVRLVNESCATSLLDVGCGSGNFLDFVTKQCAIDVVGLDTVASSVAACRRNGHHAECMTLEEYLVSDQRRAFDLVTAFHCLEHVADPLALVQSMAQALSPRGRVVLSFPYSPASWEVLEVAALNMPPHHVTRWNKPAIRALGEAAGLDTKVSTDAGTSQSSIGRSVYWLFRSTVGLEPEAGLPSALATMCLHPAVVAKCVRFCTSRDRVDGALAGDTAFVVLERVPTTNRQSAC